MPAPRTVENIDTAIHIVRGLRVMLDSDLAAFYGVTTKVLNQAVRRNKHRFPEDFAFPITNKELTNLRSQIVTSSSAHGGRRFLPWAFTEHGAVMLAGVLNSAVAIAASVEIVRVFVRMRNVLSNSDLVSKLVEIERRIDGHDTDLATVFRAIKQLIEAPRRGQKEIGFHTLREDTEGCDGLGTAPRRRIRYPAKRRTRKEKH